MCLALVLAAVIVAVRDGKVASLLIGAAVSAVTTTGVLWGLKRYIVDAYDEGKRAERRALARELDELQRRG
jgi:hypothetical protein